MDLDDFEFGISAITVFLEAGVSTAHDVFPVQFGRGHLRHAQGTLL